MKIVGLITEYNPFHNGHLYHIEKAKEIAKADAAIVVMSGNFVQRGAPAIMPKHLRAKAALESGADLVLELPVPFATGSAEFFAEGAVSLLDSLGCVDALCFGSECGNSDELGKIAQILADEPEAYKTALQDALREGLSFPSARAKALSEYADNALLEQPNNILGIEYMKALYKRKSAISCYSVKRIGAGYHADELVEEYSSASAIRKNIADSEYNTCHENTDALSCKNTDLLSELQTQIPPASFQLLKETYQSRYPVYANDFSLLLKYKLMQETKESLITYLDVSEDLANRIMNLRNTFTTFDGFCDALKTKELTYSRISRSLLHILLNIKTDAITEYRQNGCCYYAHVLGFKKNRADILTLLKETSRIPLLTKLTQTEALSDTGKDMLAQDIFASDLYESVITEKFKTAFISEYRQQIMKI